MTTNDLKLSSALVLKLREYNFNNDQMIEFALSLGRFIDMNKLSQLMMSDEQINFDYDVATKTFELIDPSGLMGGEVKTITLNH